MSWWAVLILVIVAVLAWTFVIDAGVSEIRALLREAREEDHDRRSD